MCLPESFCLRVVLEASPLPEYRKGWGTHAAPVFLTIWFGRRGIEGEARGMGGGCLPESLMDIGPIGAVSRALQGL